MHRLSVAKVIYGNLIKNNIEDVFLYSGGSVMPLIDLFHPDYYENNNGDKPIFKPKINYFINSNEANAGMAAVAYSKSNNRKIPGVLITTSGPSIMSTINAMADATNDSTPLIVISGQVSTASIGTNAFQEAPAVEISKNVTKASFLIKTPENADIIMKKAFKIATTGKMGAVHIDVPKDIMVSDVLTTNKPISEYLYNINNIENYVVKYDLSQLKVIAHIINNSKLPIIIAGKGCNDAVLELKDFMKKGNIAAASTLHGLGVIHPYFNLNLGMCGMHGSFIANTAIQNSDCIIAIGSRFDDRITGNIKGFAPKATNIIHIDIEKKQVNTVLKHRKCKYLIGDASTVLKKLTPLIYHPESRYNIDVNTNPKLESDKLRIIQKVEKDMGIIKNKKEANIINLNKIYTRDLIYEINKYNIDNNNDDVIYTSGVGKHQMYMAQMLKLSKPRSFITSGSLGDMNAAMGYTVGAQIANPDKLVIGILGDGSFNMGSNELATIARYKLPVKIFIDNNSSLEMVHSWEKLFFNNRRVATKLYNPDFEKLAESYGIQSMTIKNKDEIRPAVEIALNHNGPFICNVITKPDFCFPLVPPGKNLDQMQFSKDNYVDTFKKIKIVPS